MTPINKLTKLSHDWTVYLSSMENKLTLTPSVTQIIHDYIQLAEDENNHLMHQYEGTQDYQDEMYYL